MSKLTTTQLNRLIELGHLIWSDLTEDEQDAYALSDGTYQFIEDLCALLHINTTNIPLDQFDYVHDTIIYGQYDNMEDEDYEA